MTQQEFDNQQWYKNMPVLLSKDHKRPVFVKGVNFGDNQILLGTQKEGMYTYKWYDYDSIVLPANTPTTVDQKAQEPMIYHIDEFFDDIQALVEKLTDYETGEKAKEILRESFPDGITIEDCSLKPMHIFDKADLEHVHDLLFGRIPEENWPDPDDACGRDEEQVDKAIAGAIDLVKLNNAIPELWYPNGEKTHYSLEELEGMI